MVFIKVCLQFPWSSKTFSGDPQNQIYFHNDTKMLFFHCGNIFTDSAKAMMDIAAGALV